MINYIFIGVVAVLLLIMLVVGIQLYYDVSLKQKRKKFSYVFKVIMKNDSEYSYEFYSNSKKKKREYLLRNYILANEREIVVKEENGFDAYYPVSEIKKIKFSIRPAKKNAGSRSEFENLFSKEINQENVAVEDSKVEMNNQEHSAVSVVNSSLEQLESSVDEKNKTLENDFKVFQEEEKNQKEKPYENQFDVPEKKKMFSEFRKVKKVSKRDTFQPKKAVNSKLISSIVCMLILLVSFSGVFAFLGLRSSNGDIKELKSEVALKAESENAEQPDITESLIESYLNPFVVDYMTIPVDKENLDKRNNQLKKYFSFSTDFSTIESDKRVLTSKALYDVEKQKEYYLAKYVVNYDLITKKVGSDGKALDDKRSKTVLLAIPARYEKGKFTIIDYPYFSDLPNLQSNAVIDLPTDVDKSEAVSTKDSEKINVFLNQFLSKYATGKKEDLAYMMEIPEGLNGLYELKETVNKIYKAEDSYTVLSKVTFAEPNGSITHVENMKFTLENKDGKYFITKLEHVLGGN
ncbi:conjugal transfer protein [Carnobacterium maltaromaticum]|uniref:conjugal transfer protein n=1 Tax=Carnobacterium maltaromaticum TaxID=2751 RepID=UPI0039BDB9A1